MRHRTMMYGLGGYRPDLLSNNVVSDVTEDVPGLGTDRDTIPADGVTPATLNYYTADPTATTANWSINGATHSEALVNGASEIQVTATATGTLAITCNEASLILTAE